ncbi:MAG: tRNA pseudouridine(38-40) synthase TruA [Lachnospiraceae bacterium]|nr:tRNA pseudouridine(38-40) synthase TruA [Lachnospiraceae bacterium]
MKRIMLRVSYDGTDYCGWQKQSNGLAVEEALNRAISELTGTDIFVAGASRTDAGVHALGNVAVFDTDSPIPADKFSFALNQRLPSDIAVQESCEVEPDFHPRYCECVKTYEYRIYNGIHRNPLYSRFTYHFHHPLDVRLMNEAARYLTGEHDFASFCSAGAQVKNTVRTIYDAAVESLSLAEISPDTQLITIRLRGNGFLYNMVRIIAGTLIRAGQGEFAPEHMSRIIDAADRSAAGPTAPPQGLTLMKIEY